MSCNTNPILIYLLKQNHLINFATMVKVCVVKSCSSGRTGKKKNNRMPLSFFQPTTPTRLINWTKSMGINLKATDSICQFHFKEEHIKMYDKIKIGEVIYFSYLLKKVLKEEALPTIEHQFHPLLDQQQSILKVQELLIDPQNSCYSTDYIEQSQESLQEQVQIEKTHNDSREQELIESIDYFKNNVSNFLILPEFWFYIEKPRQLEFMRIDRACKQIKNHIRLNEDLSITVILLNNEELCTDLKISSFENIYDYLKSVEKWPLCVGTQIERNKYSKKCRGVIIGEEAYKRFQRNPRCKSCRILRNQLKKRKLLAAAKVWENETKSMCGCGAQMDVAS